MRLVFAAIEVPECTLYFKEVYVTIQVTLIGDRPLTLQGIKSILENDPGIEITGVGTGLDDSLEEIREHQPDVAILDLETVSNTNLDIPILDSERACYSSVEVVTLLNPRDADFARGLIDAGVRGCLMKTDERLLSLNRVVHRVSRGKRVYSQEALQAHFDHEFTLTIRELQVLRLICRGKTNKEIARELMISHGTVRNYISSIYDELEIPIGEKWNRRVIAAIRARELSLL